MKAEIETKVPPHTVWTVWEQTHGLKEGGKGKTKYKFQIVEIKPHVSFSILWKSLFASLVFTYKVRPHFTGSIIEYHVQIKGLFSWLIQKLSQKRIQRSLSQALREMVRSLANESIK